jgi:hypothetical protein
MTKKALPPIDNELAAPRLRIDLKSLKTREPMTDEAVEANSHTIGKKWGATTQLPMDAPSVPLAPVASIRGYIPQYLDNELSIKAAERRVTKTYLIVEALEKAGYHVNEIDLIPDRRRSRQKGNL